MSDATPETTAELTAEMQADIVAACHIVSGEKLAGSYGHVSARTTGGGRFAISARMSLAAIEHGQVEVVDVSCESLPGGRVPIEAYIHSEIYGARPDVQAIVRTHSEACSVLGALGHAIRPVHALGALVSSPVPIHRPCVLITSPESARVVAAALGASDAIVLRGNGLVVTGSSIREACIRAVFLEESARLQMLALSAGSADEIAYLTDEECVQASADLGTPAQIERCWNHYRFLHP